MSVYELYRKIGTQIVGSEGNFDNIYFVVFIFLAAKYNPKWDPQYNTDQLRAALVEADMEGPESTFTLILDHTTSTEFQVIAREWKIKKHEDF